MFANQRLIFLISGFLSLFVGNLANALNCSVSADPWSTGYVANVSVNNDSNQSIEAWQVQLNFNQPANIVGFWNADISTNGSQLTAVNASYNGYISAGGTVTFGFQGEHNGDFELPLCNPGSGITPPPTATPAPTTTPTPTATPQPTPTAEPPGLYPDYNTDPQPDDISGMDSDAVALASRIKLGWNIGNTMEAIGGETAWGNPLISEELIRLVKANGFDSIRLPVSWNDSANQSTAEIDGTWLDRVKQVVQMCIDNDLTVLVNIHWDGGWLENNISQEAQNAVAAKQKAFWQQIATHLRDFDERLMFASANEPHVENASEMSVLLSYHQTFVDAVRSTGGKNAYRVLVVQGPSTDIEKTNQYMTQMPTDTVPGRLMAEVHFYSPYQFTLMTADESWGNQFFYWGEGNHSSTDTDHNPTWGEEAWVDETFALMQAQFVNQGIPVILGEYGVARRSGQLSGADLDLHLKSRAYWNQYITQSALDHGLLPYYWDNGGTDAGAFGIFDRDSNVVYDQQVMDALRTGAGLQ